MAIKFQLGQPDLELAACDTRVLLAPYVGTPPLLDLEDPVTGDIDQSKIGAGSRYSSVGNHEKKAGIKLSNKVTVNEIKSAGQGSPTRNLISEAPKSITYTPQETKLVNLQNAWGFTPNMVSVSAKGGIRIHVPSLPARTLWRAVLLALDTFNGEDVWLYWIANRAEVAEREDQNAVDSNVLEYPTTLKFSEDPVVGDPVIFGACGAGFTALMAATDSGGFYPEVSGITIAPDTITGAAHTAHQLTVTDSNGLDRTATATYATSDPTKATVSSTGLVTLVAGGAATVSATYLGKTDTCAVTVTS